MNNQLKKTFFEATVASALQPVYYSTQGAMLMDKYYGVNHRFMPMIIEEKDRGIWGNWLEDMQEVGRILVEKMLEPQFFSWVEKNWVEKIKYLEKVFKKIDGVKLSELSDKQLSEMFKEFHDVYLDFWALGKCCHPMHFGLDEAFENQLSKLVDKKSKKFIEYSNILSQPTKKSFYAQAEENLEKIAREARQLNLEGKSNEEKNKFIFEQFGKKLAEHSRKYFWIENNYATTKILAPRDFAEKIVEDLQTPKKSGEHTTQAVEAKEKALQELKADEDFVKLIELMDYMAWFQDERKKYNLIADHYLDVLLAEVGRRSGYSLYEMKYTLPSETLDLLHGKKIDKGELKERMKFHIVFYTHDTPLVVTGEKARKMLAEWRGEKNEVVTQVYGTPACTGVVIGKARRILAPADISKMQEGDILIASMTRPDLLPALKKAAAVVTDEGGLTCHAAVVSRELGIPCVVGTRIATKVFQDGDLLEVRAHHGLVRKIKQSEVEK